MAFVTLATYPSFLSKSLTWNFPKVQWHMHGWLVVGAFYSPKLEDRILDRKPDWPVSLWPCVLLSGQRARLASVIMTLCTAAWSEKGTCIYFVIDRLWQWCPAVVINCIRSGNMGTSTHIHTCIPPTHICTHTCHTHTCSYTAHTHTHTYIYYNFLVWPLQGRVALAELKVISSSEKPPYGYASLAYTHDDSK